MADNELKIAKMAMLYELRLLLSTGEKSEYTREELLEMLDKLALAKDQD